jgi:hypothetical protein
MRDPDAIKASTEEPDLRSAAGRAADMNLTANTLTRLSREGRNNVGRGSGLSERPCPQMARPGRERTTKLVQWLSLFATITTLTLALDGALASRWQQVGGGASQAAGVPARAPDSLSETLNIGASGARCESLFGSYNSWLYTNGHWRGPCGLAVQDGADAVP